MTYLDQIRDQSQVIQEALINEAPHTIFSNVPSDFPFLAHGVVDLGFENMGMGDDQFKATMLGFSGNGIKIPGTPYKMRARGSLRSVIEPIGADEELPELPVDWKEAVMVIDGSTGNVIYAGKKVRPSQLGT